MVASCAVYGCTLRRDQRTKLLGIAFYKFPTKASKRQLWIKAINRHNWQPTRWHVVCSRHFVSGNPSKKPNDVDYCPTKYLKGGDFVHASVAQNKVNIEMVKGRRKRASRRLERSHIVEMAEVLYLKLVYKVRHYSLLLMLVYTIHCKESVIK